MKHLIVFLLSVMLLHPTFTVASELIKISYQVLCDDASAMKQISSAIEERLKRSNFEITEKAKLPVAKLFVYAQQDLNDRVNRNGWSFAIAHVSNYLSYHVAGELLDSTCPEVSALKPVLISMLNEEGFIKHMNIVHVDELTEETIATITDSIVGAFSMRVTNVSGGEQ